MKIVARNLPLLLWLFVCCAFAAAQQTDERSAFETTYDEVKDQTTFRLLPVKISGEKDKYYSLHMSPAFSYPGKNPSAPSIIDFELQTVVKGRLSSDLYVVFVIDGKPVFLSSTRWAVKRPVPGRLWMGERLVFRMPYETLLKLAEAKHVGIKMDSVLFDLAEPELQTIRDFTERIKKITPLKNTAAPGI